MACQADYSDAIFRPVTLDEFCKALPGGRRALAEAIHTTGGFLWQIAAGRRPCPPYLAVAIEAQSAGQVPVEQMVKTARWHRIPDPAWPHPGGRPMLDYGRPADRPDEIDATPPPAEIDANEGA